MWNSARRQFSIPCTQARNISSTPEYSVSVSCHPLPLSETCFRRVAIRHWASLHQASFKKQIWRDHPSAHRLHSHPCSPSLHFSSMANTLILFHYNYHTQKSSTMPLVVQRTPISGPTSLLALVSQFSESFLSYRYYSRVTTVR
jgi:hypothetical protein